MIRSVARLMTALAVAAGATAATIAATASGAGGAAAAVRPATGSAGGAGGAGAAGPAARCAGVFMITSLAFSPAQVQPGQAATASLAARNCTGQAQQAAVQWYGRYLGPGGTTLPAGCPVIDPVAAAASAAPHGTYRGSLSYLVLSGCTAAELQLTVTLAGPGGAVEAQATADLTIVPGG